MTAPIVLPAPRTSPVPGEPCEPASAPWAAALHALADRHGLDPARLLAVLTGLVIRRYGCGWSTETRTEVWSPGDWPGDAALLELAAHGAADTVGPVRIRVASAGAPPAGAQVHAEVAPGSVTFTVTDATVDEHRLVRLIAHTGRALAALEARPDATVASADILTDEETSFLERHQGSVVTYPDTTLHRLFLATAARRPDGIALVDGDRTTTYAELRALATTVAADLAAAGVTPRSIVGLVGPRSTELFAGLLGILMAGCAVCYLDPVFPAAYREAVADQAGIRTVVTTRAGREQVPAPTRHVVEARSSVPGPPPAPVSDGGVGPEDPAYVIFTSGTTGTPRGVVRPHRMHTSRIALEQSLYAFGDGDRHLLKSPISFREFLWPLASGGTAVIARPGGEKDDRYLLGLLARERVNVVSFVPSMLRVLSASPEFHRLEDLRHVFVGGEALDTALEARVRAAGPAVHNTYTLTEYDYATHRSGPREGTTCSIGTPLDSTIRLLDPDGRRVPPGCWGEVYAGGPGLATGYLGAPAQAARRFLDVDGLRMFRTGDLARFLPDGHLEYGGRRDLQIKVRGLRVEPGEVESVLRALPGVVQGSVVGQPDKEQGAQLVAFVQPDPDKEVTAAGLRAELAERLPAHCVPRLIVMLPVMPLLLSGKIDRSALKPPSRGVLEGARPIDGTEAELAALWCSVLGLEEVGTDLPFVTAGGDSLRVLVLRAAMEDAFGIVVPLGELMKRVTVQEQAVLVRVLQDQDGSGGQEQGASQDQEALSPGADSGQRRTGIEQARLRRRAARARSRRD
ncbi:non-ribosomal peptide synthetase [Streptomyces sp. NPDC050388]|uniref:non-ribosomal peptide synthetase n=1 Tax=Streptomyces sp. NPDC050388 TaxID=3155781 RepID=UPI0034318B79